MCFPPGRCPKQRIPHTICLALSLYQHSCLLTFHITESDHFCGHLPSKPDGFFHTPRPHAAIVHRIQPGQGAKNIASSPSISPSRTNFVIIYPQKKACSSRGSAPFFAIVAEKSNWAGAETLPLTFHITDLGHFCRNLPSKIGMFFATHRPHFDAMSAVSSPPEKTSPHIPYHRVGTILWTFNLKNQHVF